MFRYDYNMEYANAFTSNVHCLSVYVFDDKGNFVERIEESSEVLADENYLMTLDLGAGSYTLLAYGGLACDDASFDATQYPTKAEGMDDMYVSLRHEGFHSDKSLHPLFYGAAQVDVPMNDEYVKDTVYMMKNTNNIRLVLQQMNGRSLSAEDFTFSITDDNTCFDKSNNLVSKGMMTYTPWAKGDATVGTAEDGQTPVSVAYAEFSTSRLMVGNPTVLRVGNAETGDDIINIPLNNYLLLLKSQLYSEMGSQEFLDRESRWSLIFFLDDNLRWVNTRIVINDWVVRLNHTEL